MISNPKTGTAIITSLVEDAESWELKSDPTSCYITHRTRLQLSFFGQHYAGVMIEEPTWAKAIDLSREDKALIRKAIDLIVKERRQIAAGHKLIGLLTAPIPSPKPWWKVW